MDELESTGPATEAGGKPAETLPLATRAAVFGVVDTQRGVVDVPEWRMRVPIRSLTAGERDAWEKLTRGQLTEEDCKKLFRGVKLGPMHSRALLVFYGAIAEDSDTAGRLFTDPADILQLARKQSGALSRVAEAIIELSAISEEDVKELEEEFENNPTNASSTPSPQSTRSGTSRGGARR